LLKIWGLFLFYFSIVSTISRNYFMLKKLTDYEQFGLMQSPIELALIPQKSFSALTNRDLCA